MTQTATIQLTANWNGPQFDHWDMTLDGKPCVPTACPYSVDHGNNAIFNVSIHDTTNQITFSSSPLMFPPTWPPEIHHITGQNTQSLQFKDHNWHSGTLKYSFNFNKAPSIDPIIQNNGGGPGFLATYLPTTTTAFAIDLFIAFVVGMIAALILRRLFSLRRRRHPSPASN